MPTRRAALRTAGLAALGAVLSPWPASAEGQPAPAAPPAPPAPAAAAGNAPVAQGPGAFPDVWIGAPGAKATLVEYGSLTCSHCAAFHKEVWPALKTRFVDTGKVRFVLRPFPRDPLDIAGFMLSRSRGEEMYYPITDLLFDRQAEWAFVQKPVDALEAMVAGLGIDKAKFEATLKDQSLYDAANLSRVRALEAYRIKFTPTFVVDGRPYEGEVNPDALAKALDAALAG